MVDGVVGKRQRLGPRVSPSRRQCLRKRRVFTPRGGETEAPQAPHIYHEKHMQALALPPLRHRRSACLRPRSSPYGLSELGFLSWESFGGSTRALYARPQSASAAG